MLLCNPLVGTHPVLIDAYLGQVDEYANLPQSTCPGRPLAKIVNLEKQWRVDGANSCRLLLLMWMLLIGEYTALRSQVHVERQVLSTFIQNGNDFTENLLTFLKL